MEGRTVKANEYLSSYAMRGWKIDENAEFSVELVEARQLMVAQRFDLASKLYYIDCREKGRDMTFAKELYKEHIKAFSGGSFTEPGAERKNSLGAYLDTFDQLIDSLKVKGFDNVKSIVPVNQDGVILDGAHRTAIAIYYDLLIPVIRISDVPCDYGYAFFAEQGVDQKYLDFMALQYMHYTERVYAVCLWPAAADIAKRREAETLISKRAAIAYKKDVQLNYHGLEQLMIHLYGAQPWCGDVSNGFAGVGGKAVECFRSGSATRFYVIDHISLQEVLQLKNEIRELFYLENHSIHITDTNEEAIEAGQVLLNENSIDVFNYGDPFRYKSFMERLEMFKAENSEPGIVASAAVLGLYGYEDAEEIGYSDEECVIAGADDPDRSFFYYGVRFASLNVVEDIVTDEAQKQLIQKVRKKLARAKSAKKLPLLTEQKKRSDNEKQSGGLKNYMVWNVKNSYWGRKAMSFYRHHRYPLDLTTEKDVENLRTIFENLDDTCSYAVLRNWEGFYDDIVMEGHNDIDVLCGDTYSRDMLVSALGAKPITFDGFHYCFRYKGVEVTLDTRLLGDGYYDRNWQADMLQTRRKHPLGFYVLDDENYFYSLAYHAVYQKTNGISDEYLERLHMINPLLPCQNQEEVIDALHTYMKMHRYCYTMTQDKSVVKVFDRVPDQNMVCYPGEIRRRHMIQNLKEKDYYTRLKIKLRRLLIR